MEISSSSGLVYVDIRQLVSIKPEYQWAIHARYQKLILKNHSKIDKNVEARSIPLE